MTDELQLQDQTASATTSDGLACLRGGRRATVFIATSWNDSPISLHFRAWRVPSPIAAMMLCC